MALGALAPEVQVTRLCCHRICCSSGGNGSSKISSVVLAALS